ncbi:MAG TPA: ESX secretion-associated protein EspG [Actinophytocola sp.]|uniref:ESX secretion-associated protein EspG n=1 Tax=Actinophytocola sp. TaxID=1872138 RepID=UPI002DDDA6BC|nr:ESX secretion-associated protein EspG [Actinophytocola sp.]HEV2780866.1 ESX secretion-associated protein EspG [Actinophytocola sp.]
MAGSYSLSLAAVDVLSQTLDVNARVFPFEIPSFGQLQEDRLRIARAVFNDLHKRGLVRQGTIDPDLRRALHTLADYRVAVTAMGTVGKNKHLFARASANGDTGVLAVQEDQKVRFELIRPTALAMTMVGLLPKVPAGPGQSVTLTRPAPVGARGDDQEANYFSQVRGPRSGSDQAMRIAQGYLTRPRTGSGFFAVIGKDRHGKDLRAGEVGWYDTDQGRYLSLSRPPGDDGQIHGTLSPADPARLTQQLTQLIDSIAHN